MTDMISAETVTQVWQDMAQASADEAPHFINEMRVEQPVVLAYLLAVGDALFNQHERELIFYLGMVVWQMMKQSKNMNNKINHVEE